MSTKTWWHAKCVRRREIIVRNFEWRVRLRFSEISTALCRSRGDLRCSGIHDLNEGLQRRNPRRAMATRRFLMAAESP
jgi:hypothetical protein